jgi:hypothetical protein
MHKSTGTVSKTFRFDARLANALEKSARRAEMTETALVTVILRDRLSIDPLFPAFREITMSEGTFQSILSGSDSKLLIQAAPTTGRKNAQLVRELFDSYDIPLTFEDYVTVLLGRHSHWFYIEGSYSSTHQFLTLRHSFGAAWSNFAKAYLTGVSEVLSKDKVNIESSEQYVRIAWLRAG